MIINFEVLAGHVKTQREHKEISQNTLEGLLDGVTRSNIAHLEQGYKIPPAHILKKICQAIDLPQAYWEPFISERAILRANFEIALKELVGESISSLNLDHTSIENVESIIDETFRGVYSAEQFYDRFNSILVFYGIKPVIFDFFERYFNQDSFKKVDNFKVDVDKYLIEALRLFSSLKEAFIGLNSNKFNEYVAQLKPNDISHYSKRSIWRGVTNIPDEKLPLLGYIAAEKVAKETSERNELIEFIKDIINKKKEEKYNLEDFSTKKKRRIDSLLRAYNSRIEHGLFSPLFSPSIDDLEREIKRLSPKAKGEIQEIEKYQGTAYRNLAQYLTSDFMDIYVATSMRTDADFVSVNNFVINLFEHHDVRNFRLRYFNPTQSWIEDRVAKGLVEALMLKRSQLCIYMAQKEDTFGKDSEASVSLGQGKPVVVYVPRLYYNDGFIDTATFGTLEKREIISKIKANSKDHAGEVDEEDDLEALHGILLECLFKQLNNIALSEIMLAHWADFDLYGEIDKRFVKEGEEALKKKAKDLIDQIVKGKSKNIKFDDEIRLAIVGILIAVSLRYERRAKVFREIHPLALQMILSTGVLNGIIVVRSVDSCALIIKNIIENQLSLELKIDENNYRLVEVNTQSTIRVISRHKLISNAFFSFYEKKDLSTIM